MRLRPLAGVVHQSRPAGRPATGAKVVFFIRKIMKGKGLTIEETIQLEAYLLSEKAGHPPHKEHYFWAQAEKLVHSRAGKDTASKAKSAKPAAKAPTKTVSKTKPVAAAPEVAPPAPKPIKAPAAKAKKTAPEPQLPLDGESAAKPAAKKAAPKPGSKKK